MYAEAIVVKDTATPALRALRAGLQPENLLPIFGRSASNTMRANFDDLESSRPNKLGGQRTHYYSGARAATHYVIDGNYAVVSSSQVGIRMRYFGGTIRAGANSSFITGKPTKYLTIPVTAESYGHRAADFPDLKMLWGRNGPYALARVTVGQLARGGSTANTEILFLLRAEVEIQADPSMLPSSQAFIDAINSDFNKYVRMLWRQRAIPNREDAA